MPASHGAVEGVQAAHKPTICMRRSCLPSESLRCAFPSAKLSCTIRSSALLSAALRDWRDGVGVIHLLDSVDRLVTILSKLCCRKHLCIYSHYLCPLVALLELHLFATATRRVSCYLCCDFTTLISVRLHDCRKTLRPHPRSNLLDERVNTRVRS